MAIKFKLFFNYVSVFVNVHLSAGAGREEGARYPGDIVTGC